MKTSQLFMVMVAILMLAIIPAVSRGNVDVMALWMINGKADGTISTLTTEVGKAVQSP